MENKDNVIDIPTKPEEHPLGKAIGDRLAELHKAVTDRQRDLGRLRARYLADEAALAHELARLEAEFAQTTRNALLAVDAPTDGPWTVDLKTRTIRKG